jgi:hypothetical protein
MQMKELQLKEEENQRKAAKDQADNAIRTAQQQIERERIQAQTATDDKRIKMDAIKTAAQMSADKQRHMMDKGVDVLKQLSNKSHEEQLRNMQERIQMRQQNKPTKGE